jgi:hypothetical protein
MARPVVKLWQVVVAGPILIGLGLWQAFSYESSHDLGRTADGRTLTVIDGHGSRDVTLVLTAVVAIAYVLVIARALQAARSARRHADADMIEEIVDPHADAKAQRRTAAEATARERRAAHAQAAGQHRNAKPEARPEAHPFRAAPPSAVIVEPAPRRSTAVVVKPADAGDDDGPSVLR